jgi:hypothetical protein
MQEGVRMNCPVCDRPIHEHWSLAMTDVEIEVWYHNELVCALNRGDVELKLKART